MNKIEAEINHKNYFNTIEKIQTLLKNETIEDYQPLIMSESNFEKLFKFTHKDSISKVFRSVLQDGLEVPNGVVNANGRVRKIATPNYDRDKSNAGLVWIGFQNHKCDSNYDRPRINFFFIHQESEDVKNAVFVDGSVAHRISSGWVGAPSLDDTQIIVQDSEAKIKTPRKPRKASKKSKSTSPPKAKKVSNPVVVPTSVVAPIVDAKDAFKNDVVATSKFANKPVVGEDYKLPEIKSIDNYYFPDFADEIADSILFGEHVYIYGPAGCGKSTMARLLCRMMGKEPYEVDFSSGVDEATFIGTKEATVDENGNPVTTFQYGLFPKALREGRPIIVNEMDMGQPQYLAALHGILEENDPKLVILDNGAEVIRPENGFCLIATGNSAGHGEDVGDYSGTNVLNKAFLDRFSAFFELGYTKKERQIIQKILIKGKKHLTSKIMSFVRDIRKLKESEMVDSLFSTRRLIMLVEKINRWGVKRSIDRVLLTRLEQDERETWNEVVQRHFPESFDETIVTDDDESFDDEENVRQDQDGIKLPF